MEMLQLRYFYESAKNESFTKTAKKHMVPLTSVSAAIKRLEEELGVKLFERTSNRVILNHKGRQFMQEIEHIFSRLDHAVGALQDLAIDNREIKILVRATRETVINRIITFHALHPQLEFKLNFNFSEADFEKYDLIVDEKSDRYPDFESFDLCNFRVRVEALSVNPICEKKLTLKQLRNYPFVTTGAQYDAFHVFEKACKRQGFTPKVIMECNDYNCRDKCLLAGMGLGITLGNTTNSVLPQVQYLDITDFNERFITTIYYRPSSYNGNIKAFLDFIRAKIS